MLESFDKQKQQQKKMSTVKYVNLAVIYLNISLIKYFIENEIKAVPQNSVFFANMNVGSTY